MSLTSERPRELPATVSLWRFDLDRDPNEVERLRALLCPLELRRAEGFRFHHDRDRYVAGRGQLRRALGGLTHTHPAKLQLTTNAFGKPELPGTGLSFNLTHSGGNALLATTTAGPVGVDLERCRTVPDRDLVADRFFADREVAALRRVPAGMRDAAFLRCWTRKEAYVKAVGGGLSMGLQDFAVSLDRARPAIIWAVEPMETKRWSVTDLSAYVPGHLAALVVAAPPPVISLAPNP